MKIFKKIGIGFLALIICFCSCFKFTNAESLDYISEPFTLSNGIYELYVDESNVWESYTIVASYSEGSYSCEIAFLGKETNIIQIEDINGASFEAYTTYTRSYYNPFNSTTYEVFSFVYSAPSEFVGLEFLYDDPQLCYLSENRPEKSFSVYNTIYDLVETYIFGGNIEKGSHQDLTATTLSSIICILVFALPFLVIWKVIKVIMG